MINFIENNNLVLVTCFLLIVVFFYYALNSESKSHSIQYISECKEKKVPIPPDWGEFGENEWLYQGELDNEFIAEDLTAEVYTFQDNLGLCIALPRKASKNTIKQLGIICLGKESSNACFWDNQRKNGQPFSIATGEKVAIGSFLSGYNLVNKAQICTDCHAGENPFILHPDTNLGLPKLAGLSLKSKDWYKPIIRRDWPQNSGPIESDNANKCFKCHREDGKGGRFPKPTHELKGYANIILPNAFNKTMPEGSHGNKDYAVDYHNLRKSYSEALTNNYFELKKTGLLFLLLF